MKIHFAIVACLAASTLAIASAQTPNAPQLGTPDAPPSGPELDGAGKPIPKFQMPFVEPSRPQGMLRAEPFVPPLPKACVLGNPEPCVTGENPPRTYAEPYRGGVRVYPLQR